VDTSAILPAAVGVVTGGIALTETLASVRLASAVRRSRARGVADFLLYRRFARPDVITLSNGGYLAMFEVTAADSEAFNDAALANVDGGIARALGSISERFVVHFHDRHEVVREYDTPASYPHPGLAWLDAQRERYFRGGNTYTTRRVMGLAWYPPSAVVKSVEARGGGAPGEEAEQGEAAELALFDRELASAVSFLRSYASVRRLGVRREIVDGVEVEFSEMLEAIARAFCGRNRKIAMPQTLLALNSLLAEPMRGKEALRVGEHEIAIVVLKDFPRELEPLALARLRQLGAEYDLVVRWLPLSAGETRAFVKGAHAGWNMKASETPAMTDPYALDMMGDAEAAAGMTSAGTRFGMLSPFVVLRARDRRTVDATAERALAIFDELGFSAFIASKTAEEDFFATLFGDGYHASRAYQMHELNLAYLFSLHEQSSGPRYLGVPSLPPDSPAIAYGVAGRDSTHYRVALSTDPPDVLNALMIGAPGSGKSVSLEVIVESWLARVPFAGVTSIDRGRSMYRLARFLDAPFYDLLGSESPGFALFSDVDDPQARGELADILVGMAEIQGVAVTPPRRAAIDEAIRSVGNLPRHLRSLSAFVEVRMDPEGQMQPAFRLYTRTGYLGNTLDAEEDSFDVARFSVVDLGRLWKADPKFLIPTVRVMFWKIIASIHRRRARSGNHLQHWLVPIDECHTLLRHELGVKFVQDLLKMGRREKIFVLPASNAAQEFVTSGILNDLEEACRSRFFFRNTDVLENAAVRGYYSDLGLPEHGIAMLPNIAPHSFLLHQPSTHELREVNWRLDPATLAIVGRTSFADNEWLDGMIARYPHTWREEVLRSEHVDESIIADLCARFAAAATPAIAPAPAIAAVS
jgi:type IV secretion system protein TrbE